LLAVPFFRDLLKTLHMELRPLNRHNIMYRDYGRARQATGHHIVRAVEKVYFSEVRIVAGPKDRQGRSRAWPNCNIHRVATG
jgi:hypothetical protein